jgi:hypothetical protein
VVYGLTRPSGEAALNGPAPRNEEGKPLDPAHTWGDDHCWWLDRMVRSNQPLVERMTFIWHDWFANSNEQVDSAQLMLDQNQMFREKALGSFYDLFLAVTSNPAMLVFLDGIENEKGDSNENYAREMMELFSLGADRGAYTEDDVREMGRALTGWQAEWSSEGGMHNFHYDSSKHDEGQKTVFGQTGNWDWEDAVRMCVAHPLHPSFFVTMWAYGFDEPIAGPAMEAFGQLGALGAPSPAYAQARGAAWDTSIVLKEMAPFVGPEGKPTYTAPVPYPKDGGEFAGRLEALAAMLAAGLPIKCASLTGIGTYDTHSDEPTTLSTNLGQTVESVVAFQRDLEARKLDDRVIVQLWSEFGRHPQENGSGTDHGAAGVAFLIGTQVAGTMIGEFPGLAKLDENENLVNTSDFRAMYCSLLEQWFQTEAGLVIPEAAAFERPTLLKA